MVLKSATASTAVVAAVMAAAPVVSPLAVAVAAALPRDVEALLTAVSATVITAASP